MGIGRYYLILRLALRYELEAFAARLRWRRLSFDGSPILFANAIPKSGSKLLMQIMQGVQKIAPFAPVSMWPMRMLDSDGRLREEQEILEDLSRLRAGDIRLGYLHATDRILRTLTQDGWCSFFLLRDPRDLLVSHVYYATEINKADRMRPIYRRLPDFSSRLETAIKGTEGYPYLPNVRRHYEYFLEFLEAPGICVLRFEDIRQDTDREIRRILDHISSRSGLAFPDKDRAVEKIMRAIRPSRSPTFRKGAVGEWADHFSSEHKRLFKEIAGDLLISLGYEKDNDW